MSFGVGTVHRERITESSQICRNLRGPEARVPIVSDATAKKAYGSDHASPLMVAAGGDSCGADSGGPLFFSEDGSVYQAGITSFGVGCGARGFPGVYTETNAGPIRSFVLTAAGR